MKKITLALCIAAAALATGCARDRDTSDGDMGVVSCARGKDCTLYCCKDGTCKNGTCESGSMGMVACAYGKDCTMTCCNDDGMCKGGACKSK